MKQSKQAIASICAVVILLAVTCISLIPTIASTSWGTNLIANKLSHYFQGTLSVEKISCNWFGAQSITGITFKNLHGELILSCPQLDTEDSLWKIALSSHFGRWNISSPQYYIRTSLTDLYTNNPQNLEFGNETLQYASLTPHISIAKTAWHQNLGTRFGTIVINHGTITITSPQIDPIIFHDIMLKADIPHTQQQVGLNIQCQTMQNQIQGYIDLTATIDHLQEPTPSILAQATISQLPVLGIDQIIKQLHTPMDGLLVHLIGPTLDMNIHVERSSQTFQFDLEANSPQFSAQLSTQNANGIISLKNPGLIKLTMPPTSFAKFSELIPTLKEIVLTQPTTFLLNISQLSMPNMGNELITSFEITTIIESKTSQMSYELHLNDLFSPDVSGTASMHVKQLPFDFLTLGDIQLAFSDEITLITPLSITYTPPQQPPIACIIDNLQLKLHPLSVRGLLQIPLFTIASQKTALIQTQIPFEINSTKGSALIQCTSQIQTQNQTTGTLNWTANLSNLQFTPSFNMQKALIQSNGHLSNVPASLIGSIFKYQQLEPLIGSTLNCTFKGVSGADKQTLDIQATSSSMNLNMKLALDGTTLYLQDTQTQATWTLSPTSYLAIDQLFNPSTTQSKPPFLLQEPSTFNLNVAQLRIPILYSTNAKGLFNRIPSIDRDYSKWKIDLNGNNPRLHFANALQKESIQLLNSIFQVHFDTSAQCTFSSTVENGTDREKIGSVSGSALIDQILNSTGQFDLQQLKCKIDLKAVQFPSSTLDMLVRTQGKSNFVFMKLFGKTINAEISSQINQLTGPLAISIYSPNSKFNLDGQLSQGILTLNKPIYFQSMLTPEMSTLFLKEMNPLSISSIYSKDPITLEISPKDFSLSLYPFDAKKMFIPSARIELGKIYCQNEGNINITLGLLKNNQFNQNQELMLWFAPIDLQANQGIIDVERTEILLANTFDIAIWGRFNMVKDYVDALLGLPASTLNKAFGIKGLPEKYVLTIPMKGPSNNVQINTSKATSKIALLLAWQQKRLAGGTIGGPAGAIVGELLSKIPTLPDQNAKVPPAKHPFPWEEGKYRSKKSTSDRAEGKKRYFKGDEKPLKQFLKVIR